MLAAAAALLLLAAAAGVWLMRSGGSDESFEGARLVIGEPSPAGETRGELCE